MNDKNQGRNKGCFITIFIFIASGIFPALKASNEGPIGQAVIIIFGIIAAWGIANALSGD